MLPNTLELVVTAAVDPTLSVTVTKVNEGGYASEYRGVGDGKNPVRLNVRHTSYLNKKTGQQTDRHNVEAIVTLTGADGKPLYFKAYTVFELPANSTSDIPYNLGNGIAAICDATMYGPAIIGWQS